MQFLLLADYDVASEGEMKITSLFTFLLASPSKFFVAFQLWSDDEQQQKTNNYRDPGNDLEIAGRAGS